MPMGMNSYPSKSKFDKKVMPSNHSKVTASSTGKLMSAIKHDANIKNSSAHKKLSS